MSDVCVFCGKSSGEVKFMIQGPGEESALCNNCAAIVGIISNQAYLDMAKIDCEIENNAECQVDDGENNNDINDENEEDYLNDPAAGYQPLTDEQIKALEEDLKDCEDFFCDTEELVGDLERPRVTDKSEPKKKITPKDIVEMLDKHVIGQDKAKKTLAVAMYNHKKRLEDKTRRIKKSNIMMVGPSGSGKTLLAQTLANIIDVPFAIADATSLTETGYVGDDVESIIARLLEAANGDLGKAEQGIIYIDEIDKIARKPGSKSGSRDVSGEGVQHALLKIIEGAEVSVSLDGGRKHPNGRNIMVDTSNILFICGGAFEGLEEVEETKKKTIGFGYLHETETNDTTNETKNVSPDMLVKYGMIPEFMGRLPVVVKLEELKEKDLVNILTEPEYALVKEYKLLLAEDDVELEFDEEALCEIAKVALDRHIGARGLRSIMEDMMLDIMYTVPSSEKPVRRCIITKDTVHNNKPVLKYRRAKKKTVACA